MQAAILYGREDLRVEERTMPALGRKEVRVRIESALTCGTDLKVFKRGYHAKMIRPPAPFGHELAGVIIEVGSEVQNWKEGDKVVAANSAPCGTCPFCLRGQENLCDDLLFLNGAYAQSIVVPARIVEKNLLLLKSHTPSRDAALVEPLACVVQGLNDLQLRAEDRVLIIGAGPIGLMFLALAIKAGARVWVAGRGEKRLQQARKLGAVEVMDVSVKQDLLKTAHEAQWPEFDAVIEAVGKPETWEVAVELAGKGGRINFFGGCPSGSQVRVNADRVHYSSLRLLGSFHHTPATIRQALALIESGAIQAGDFIDGQCPLSELPALFHSMVKGNRAIKVEVLPH